MTVLRGLNFDLDPLTLNETHFQTTIRHYLSGTFCGTVSSGMKFLRQQRLTYSYCFSNPNPMCLIRQVHTSLFTSSRNHKNQIFPSSKLRQVALAVLTSQKC